MRGVQRKNATLLVVDDEPEVRSMLADYLSEQDGYKVLTAENGKDALDNVFGKHPVDLVLSDINMPVMKGFELLQEVRNRYPTVKRVLITAYNVEDYAEMALNHDVGNIFVKSPPFDFNELSTILNNLLTGDIFGAERYFEHGCASMSHLVRRGDAIDPGVKNITAQLPEHSKLRKLNLVLVELLTNAIFYGIRKEDPEKKELWNYDFELKEHDAIRISVCQDSSKYAISITDNGGRLKKRDVLYWLHRQTTRDSSGVPVGLHDNHGRGLFIARKYIDRLVINIAKGRATEIIIMNYLNYETGHSKPLYINEL